MGFATHPNSNKWSWHFCNWGPRNCATYWLIFCLDANTSGNIKDPWSTFSSVCQIKRWLWIRSYWIVLVIFLRVSLQPFVSVCTRTTVADAFGQSPPLPVSGPPFLMVDYHFIGHVCWRTWICRQCTPMISPKIVGFFVESTCLLLKTPCFPTFLFPRLGLWDVA